MLLQAQMPEDLDDYETDDGPPELDMERSDIFAGKVIFLPRRATKTPKSDTTDLQPIRKSPRKKVISITF